MDEGEVRERHTLVVSDHGHPLDKGKFWSEDQMRERDVVRARPEPSGCGIDSRYDLTTKKSLGKDDERQVKTDKWVGR